jgi:hypothetical protein
MAVGLSPSFRLAGTVNCLVKHYQSDQLRSTGGTSTLASLGKMLFYRPR